MRDASALAGSGCTGAAQLWNLKAPTPSRSRFGSVIVLSHERSVRRIGGHRPHHRAGRERVRRIQDHLVLTYSGDHFELRAVILADDDRNQLHLAAFSNHADPQPSLRNRKAFTGKISDARRLGMARWTSA